LNRVEEQEGSYGELLFPDNYFAAHGRNSYAGDRYIQVSLLN